MAVVTLTDKNDTLSDEESIRSCLKTYGIDYERWSASYQVAADASPEDVLHAYAKEIDDLKTRGGYVTADVIDVTPETPGLDEMLAKFDREHWHDEDEVRFVIAGHGLFHIHTEAGVVAIEVEAGDLIRVPQGTKHWFNLCGDRRIRAIRLFQDTSGWTPRYTESNVDRNYQPLCLGTSYFPNSAVNH
ncbi:MAG TPA: cupin domain-containing protein [Pyrinomonadaceae bacterium]|jgi:1,2-dihydroxy-3-keto-5-methylthiopentene dioxygenase|nr:cupin domain-containing protein [Pyrinomonadaceae bacterium]